MSAGSSLNPRSSALSPLEPPDGRNAEGIAQPSRSASFLPGQRVDGHPCRGVRPGPDLSPGG
eukprot:42322-Pyramimonas_sp.AAC.2